MNKKYNIYTPFDIPNTQLNQYKKEIDMFYNNQLSYEPDFKIVDFIFVFGGDGTFIQSLKDLVDYNKKIILISTTRLGFLSSLTQLDNCIFDDELYKTFDYLKVKINEQTINVINEIKINTKRIESVSISISNQSFKNVLTDEIEVCNNIGSTGINRSKLRPIILPNSKHYLFSVNNEPIYQYNKPLLQSLMIDNNSSLSLEYSQKNKINIRFDNNDIELDNVNKILINQTESKLKILNFCNLTLFFNKIKSLL